MAKRKKDMLDGMSREELKAFIREYELDLRVRKAWTDDELRDQIRELVSFEDADDETAEAAVEEPVEKAPAEETPAPAKPRGRSRSRAVEPEQEPEPAAQPAPKNPLKGVVTVLAVVAVALAGLLAWIWYDKDSLNDQLETEKQELTADFVKLQNEYKDLHTSHAMIQSQLDSSRAEVDNLVERLKETQARDRAAIRAYQKELGTLRDIMKSYITQIDSLNTANKQLKSDNRRLREDVAEKNRQNEELSTTVAAQADQIALAQMLKARGIRLYAENRSGREIKNPSRNAVQRFAVSLSLIENALAAREPVRVFAVIKDPEGNVLQGADSVEFGEGLLASASREVDYQGSELDMVIYYNKADKEKFVKGVYTVEVYTLAGRLGGAELMLR